MSFMSSEVEINGVYSNVVVEAHEKNEIQLKEMIESIKDVVTCYVIDRASTRIVVRKVGYNGFTVSFNYFKPTGEWSINSGLKTPENISFMINNFGQQMKDDSEFYKASKEYSKYKNKGY